jgi:DNA polymerase (family 10)
VLIFFFLLTILYANFKYMTVDNQEIAGLFAEVADLLEIDGANPFRVRAYRTAAQLLASYSHSLAGMVAKKEDLTQLPGIGADLAEKIKIIVKTGRLPMLEQLEKRLPKPLIELLKLPGLGPKKVKALYEHLKINNFADLEEAAHQHKIRELRGFSEKTESAILREISKHLSRPKRFLYSAAEEIGAELVEYLKNCPGVKKAIVAGSLRRKKETVGDLDLLVTARTGSKIIDYFISYDKVALILAHGGTRASVQLQSGMNVDLRVVAESSFGAALAYFTGSKAHNIHLRQLAIKKKLKINEYGVFQKNKKIAGKTEEEVYKSVDLPYIEPELREDSGEFAAAKQNQLPRLITLADIRGDLHCHTKETTDARDSLETLVEHAIQLGYKYLAISDHTQHLAVAKGLTPKRLLAQIEVIDRLNEKLHRQGKTIRILKSAEIDILENGKLDMPLRVLKKLDFSVCSIHFKFDLPQRRQTERVMRAMDNPHFTIWGHPSGRLINRRQACDLDFERILTHAKERNCFLEINAQPDRLDLPDELCRLAKNMGIKMVISTDAHSADQLLLMPFGINQARRGWLEPTDVLNCLSLTDLLEVFYGKL